MGHTILLISCPDQRGITASVTDFIYKNNGNIIHADQHIDEQSNTFFMRIEWSLEDFGVKRERIGETFKPIAEKFRMAWDMSFTDDRPRTAIFVSQHLHCLQDLLYRHGSGQLNCEIPLVISNHSDAKSMAKDHGCKFVEIPITKENKKGQEGKELELLAGEKIDLIVLARYHQIFTADFVAKYHNRIINIHHSFLPAFVGKNPYLQAYEKGVKLIGATSHFVTEQLDEGPIIEQATVRISHRDALEDLVRKGEDLEKTVLNRAVRLAIQKKILNYGNKTVIFD